MLLLLLLLLFDGAEFEAEPPKISSNKILLRTAAMELAKSYSWSEIAKKSIEIYQNNIGYEKDIASNKE